MKLKRIGLCLLLEHTWNREMLPGIARYARMQGDWQVIAVRNLPEFLPHQLPDGIIGALRNDDHSIQEFMQKGVKIVGISGYDPPAGVPMVTHDDEAIGRMAARHLVERNLRRFACLHIANSVSAQLRLAGFCKELQKLDMEPPTVWTDHPFELEVRLREIKKPAGIFAVNDRRALHVAHAAQECGISIPSDLALIGVDNDIVDCELCTVPISSIALAFDQQGWQAAKLLDRLMSGEIVDDPLIRIPPLNIVVRQSTEYLLVEDPLVRKAVSLMRRHMAESIGTEVIADKIGVSRRHLEYRFRSATGSSVAKELRRLRLEEAKRLLQDTPMRIQEIAEAAGFYDLNRFGLYFKSYHGQSPTDFRKQQKR